MTDPGATGKAPVQVQRNRAACVAGGSTRNTRQRKSDNAKRWPLALHKSGSPDATGGPAYQNVFCFNDRCWLLRWRMGRCRPQLE